MDDLPPPLEDMSFAFFPTQKMPSVSEKKSVYLEVEENSEIFSMTKQTAKTIDKKETAKPLLQEKTKPEKNNPGAFSGLAGAFSGKKNQVKPKVEKDTVPFIKPESKGKNDSLVFTDVQEALHANPSWCTPDVMTKMFQDPVLKEGFTNPKLTAIMNELQVNPKECMRKYGTNPEFATFMSRFCSLMLNSLNVKLDEEKTNDKVAVNNTYSRPQPTDEQKMRWMSDPVLVGILNDPDTGKMIEEMNRDPSKFKQFSQTPQIKALIKAGIIETNNKL